MVYSEARIVKCSQANVAVLIFIANFIKGKFGIKTKEVKDNVVREEPVKIIEVKDTLVREGRVEAIKKLSNKLDKLNRRLMWFMKR